MFEYSLAHWSAFLAAAFLLNVSPGPDMAFILSHTVKGGKKAGLAAMLGIWTGASCHVLLAALGLTAIVAGSAMAFSVVKWAGVAYLLWLGVQAIRSDGGTLLVEKRGKSVSIGSVFRQGVFIDLLNPKVATFFLAFLPQFVVEGAGPVWAQLLLHGVLIIAVAAFVEPPVILCSDRLTEKLRRSRSLRVWLDRGLGSVLIALGVRLALTER
ncbi:LysE family translocator [Pseudodesulfovibrio senegalensis]|uniref:LysE family translocator n=1 Tax=Pseudodesulfovibrio senegalensis TaxID=1721087 RepID=A0A6N6N1R1_9BACT|nr:LysE family translocator [Pseudodesulfovibrio senegalensis]KAB1441335.1 LysE family translocator [Pseudodesulfovibrio senegalensis]